MIRLRPFRTLSSRASTASDAEAARFLEAQFSRLAHVNMRIAAAESLFSLRNRFGPEVLDYLQASAFGARSAFRRQVIDLFVRLHAQVRDHAPEEYDRFVSIALQVVNTGDAEERAALLDGLGKVDPERAWRLALSMTFSSAERDREQGVERLWQLWQEASASSSRPALPAPRVSELFEPPPARLDAGYRHEQGRYGECVRAVRFFDTGCGCFGSTLLP